MKQTTHVRVATLVPCLPTLVSPRAIEGGVAGIFFEGQAVLSRRPGYEHLDLADRHQVPVRRVVTSGSSGRLLRASFYVPVGDRLACRELRRTVARQARKRRNGGEA